MEANQAESFKHPKIKHVVIIQATLESMVAFDPFNLGNFIGPPKMGDFEYMILSIIRYI